jgi:hypothetical protein
MYIGDGCNEKVVAIIRDDKMSVAKEAIKPWE